MWPYPPRCFGIEARRPAGGGGVFGAAADRWGLDRFCEAAGDGPARLLRWVAGRSWSVAALFPEAVQEDAMAPPTAPNPEFERMLTGGHPSSLPLSAG